MIFVKYSANTLKDTKTPVNVTKTPVNCGWLLLKL